MTPHHVSTLSSDLRAGKVRRTRAIFDRYDIVSEANLGAAVEKLPHRSGG